MINFMVNEFHLFKLLGKGGFGKVYLGRQYITNRLYAVKQLERSKPDSDKSLKNELRILKDINHKNIANLKKAITTCNHHYIVIDYCNGGTLTECLQKYKKIYGRAFPEGIVQYLMRQIVDVIKYLHQKRIIHRDIKLDNILVHFENEYDRQNLNMYKATIKLIDFGLSNYLDPSNVRHSNVGTLFNMDPIILRNIYQFIPGQFHFLKNITYNETIDIYSLGTVCYEMLVGHNVFYSSNFEFLQKLVEKGDYYVPTYLSRETFSFLNGMLQYDYTKRLNADALSKHPFLSKNVNDFKPMNFTRLYYKLDAKGLKINIKLNQTITTIFQEDYQKPLFNIPENYINEKPLPELDEFIQNNNNVLNNNPNNYNNNNIYYMGQNFIYNNANNVETNNRAQNLNNNNYNEYPNYNHLNNQYGNIGFNAKPNPFYKNMPYYHVDLNSNKNRNNNRNRQQQVIPFIEPMANNMAYQYHQNDYLNYQANNQILFNNEFLQYQQPYNFAQQYNIYYQYIPNY